MKTVGKHKIINLELLSSGKSIVYKGIISETWNHQPNFNRTFYWTPTGKCINIKSKIYNIDMTTFDKERINKNKITPWNSIMI